MRGSRLAALACGVLLLSSPSRAQQAGDWFALDVPGGDATLKALGVDAARPRATVMIDLIRRLQFSTQAPARLQGAIKNITAQGTTAVTLPLPLSPGIWEKQIFGRAIPPARMFQEILNDPPARLLYHGLAGLDAETRTWIAEQPDLLRALYRNAEAAKSFALFAPAIRIANGKVIVPGGDAAEVQWSSVLGAHADRAEAFVSHLFLDRDGRAAGLYFLIAFVDPPRQKFLLAGGQFAHLVASFAACYPRQSSDYPLVLRSKDPALLLQFINLTETGELPGLRSRALWDAVLNDNGVSTPYGAAAGPGIDAAWLVDRLCAASTVDRNAVFATLRAGQRVFAGARADQAQIVAALRVRRLFPAVFMELEHAGVQDPSTFSYVGRMAAGLDRLNDLQDAPIALQQFEGALSIVLAARVAGSITDVETRRLLSVPEISRIGERYGGRFADWIERELLPVFRKATAAPAGASAEEIVARGLAGTDTPVAVSWEGADYRLDYAASARERLLAVRAKQGGDTLDHALALRRAATDSAAVHAADAVLAQVLASWAYAPNVGTPDSGALVGGDASLRHDLGIRQVNRTRFEQRWEVAIAPGDRGSIAGSYLGLEATLAGWSLRRLASDTIPREPTLGDNDRASLYAAVSLSEPRRMNDDAMHRIAAAVAAGSAQLDAVKTDATRLEKLADRAALSPWIRASLAWSVAHDPSRIGDQFPLTARARIGGLELTDLGDWGTSAIPLGCLCLMPPSTRIPELAMGRPVDGIVGAHSADLMFRIAQLLTELRMPARIAPAVLAYAMRDFIDGIQPSHPSDVDAFASQAMRLTRTAVEDYIGAIAAAGPLQPVKQ